MKRNSNKVLILGLIIAVSGLLLSGCQPSQEKKEEAASIIESADDLNDQYKFSQALEKYDEALKIDKGNKEIYLGVSDIYVLKNRHSDAIETLKKCGDNARSNSECYEVLGKIYLSQRNNVEAIEYLKKSVASDDENYEARYYLAKSHANAADYESAERNIVIPEEEGDLYVESQILKAVVLRDNLSESQSIVESIDLDSVEDVKLRTRVEDFMNSINQINSLEESERSDIYVDVILARNAIEQNASYVAVDILDDYEEDTDEYWEYNLYLGRAYYEIEDFSTSQTFLEKAKSINPTDPTAPWLLARIYREQGSLDKMESSYKNAVALAEEDKKVEIRKEFGEVLLDEDMYVEAEDQFEALTEEDFENLDTYYVRLSEVLVAREEYEKAYEYLQKVDDSSLDDSILAKYAYLHAQVDFQDGETDKSLEWIKNAVELEKLNSHYWLLLGKIRFEKNDESEAKDSFERAIDLDLTGDTTSTATKYLDRL